ncbi:hypothetical protein CTRI78_v008553 [Colletotrichum trifolii]|uniref:Uncharacterized protein n=1 Tax=Colletotrichum trifolii TaxID=5466 RepID=A0A4V3HU96_COLTR|nr:hypothetical protein CTRI78_v008553 [Colletotrichum trifolii]
MAPPSSEKAAKVYELPFKVREAIVRMLFSEESCPPTDTVLVPAPEVPLPREYLYLQSCAGVLRDFRLQAQKAVFDNNIVNMSLSFEDVVDYEHFKPLYAAGYISAPKDVTLCFFKQLRRLELQMRSPLIETPHQTGILLARRMPNLRELYLIPTTTEMHLDERFPRFVLDVLRESDLELLVFVDKFNVVNEGHFAFARGASGCRMEVRGMARSKEPIYAMDFHHWLRGRLPNVTRFAFMGMQFLVQPEEYVPGVTRFVIN